MDIKGGFMGLFIPIKEILELLWTKKYLIYVFNFNINQLKTHFL